VSASVEDVVFDDAELDAFCRRHHIARLALFGSHLHGTATADSDVDLLVEFEDGHIPGLIAISLMEIELSQMLGDRTVDLRTLGDLSRHFRDEVAASAHTRYAR